MSNDARVEPSLYPRGFLLDMGSGGIDNAEAVGAGGGCGVVPRAR